MTTKITDYGPGKDIERPTRRLPNGQLQTLCGHKKRNGDTCRSPAGTGTDHLGYGPCKSHGGMQYSHRTHAAREQVVDKIEDMKKLGVINDEIGPEAALLNEVGRAAAAVAYFDGLVAEIARGTEHYNANQVLIEQWNEQRKMSVQTAKIIVQAGIAKQAVKIKAMQANMLAQLVLSVISAPEVALDPEQQAAARKMLASQLRNLAIEAVAHD